jgi:hypothetical protein
MKILSARSFFAWRCSSIAVQSAQRSRIKRHSQPKHVNAFGLVVNCYF